MSDTRPLALSIHENGKASLFELVDDETIIGRDENATLRIDDREVSRRHAVLRRKGQRLLIEDLGSANGSWLNGERLHGTAELHEGDELRFGSALVVLGDEACVKAKTPAPTPPAAAPAAAASSARKTSRSTAQPEPAPRRKGSSSLPKLLVAVGAVAVLVVVVMNVLNGEAPGSGPSDPTTENQQVATAKDADENPVASEKQIPELQEEFALPSGEELIPGALTLEDRFEDAVALGSYRRADRLLDRMKRPADRVARLEDALRGIADGLELRAKDLARRGRAKDAVALVQKQVENFPARSPERTRLIALAFELAPAAPAAIAKTKPAPVRPAPESGAPTGRPIASAPKPKPASGGSRVPTRRRPRPGSSRGPRPQVVRALHEKVDAFESRLDRRDYAGVEADIPALEAQAKSANALGVLPRLERLRRLIAHHRDLIALLVSRGAEAKDVDFGTVVVLGEKAKVLAVQKDGVRVQGSEGEDLFSWRLMHTGHLRMLVRRLKLDPIASVHLAALVFHEGEGEDAEKLLASAWRRGSKDPQLKRVIDTALADGRQMNLPPEGFTLEDGEWLSPRQIRVAALSKEIAQLSKGLRSRQPKERQAAFTAMLALGDEARSSLHQALIALRDESWQKLEKAKGYKSVEKLLAMRETLDERRKHALELIFDTEKYPYPYSPAKGGTAQTMALYQEHQPEVDRRVKAVNDIWKDRSSVKLGQSFLDLVGLIRQSDLWIEEAGFDAPQEPQWMLSLPIDGVLTIRTIALDPKERERIDWSDAMMERNMSRAGKADAQDKFQNRITNEYRVMMGRWAVELYDPAVMAARRHCEDMERLGFFSHFSPVRGKRTPTDRMMKEGMQPRGGGENIAIAGGPEAAHHGWLHSPGHHRNILNRGWRIQGVSHAGRRWCQVFAVSDGARKEQPK